MKIAYTSDLHVDITDNNRALIPFIKNYISKLNPDIFVIAGDVANSLSKIRWTFENLHDLSCTVIFVPGNHDIWIESKKQLRKGFDSSYKYEVTLKALCEEYGIIYPVFEPYIYKNLAIIGTIGWYDYSFRDERFDDRFTISDYYHGNLNNQVWNDTKFAIWLENRESGDWRLRKKSLSNKGIIEHIYQHFLNCYKQIPKDSKELLIITHTAPFKECIKPKNMPSPFDAYEGSSKLGEIIDTFLQNKRIICGHRHKPLLYKKDEKTIVYRSPIGYLKKDETDYETLVKERIGIIEV